MLARSWLAGGRNLFAVLAAVFVALSASAAEATAAKKLRIVLVGDSTVTDHAGWGLGFKAWMPDNVECINTAVGGRSSKSFIDEGLWQKALALKGDYYIFQFGHNDEPGKGPERETDPATTFTQFMTRYVDETRAIGAQPILVTSLTRRKFEEGNKHKLTPSLVPYAEAVRKLAAAKGVPLVDLHVRSIALCNQLGEDGCVPISPKTATGGVDATHLNPEGSAVMARLVVDELRRVSPPVAAQLRKEAGPLPPAPPAPAAAPKVSKLDLQPFEYAKGSLNEQEDRADTPRTGKVVLCLAGDSTVTYSQGYGSGLRARFDKQLQVINRSRGGRTTASFRSDGRWQDVLTIKPDYVMIQFGHNDGAVLNNEVYAKNLERFVDEARAGGIKPILVTPVSRRYWQDDGTIKDDLAGKVAAMRAVAEAKKVPLMELHERTVELYLKVGRPASETWGLPKADPANPGKTILDKTHFNAEGSLAMGRVVADELKRVVPELAAYIE